MPQSVPDNKSKRCVIQIKSLKQPRKGYQQNGIKKKYQFHIEDGKAALSFIQIFGMFSVYYFPTKMPKRYLWRW